MTGPARESYRPSVAIVGAGVAGLSLALELAAADVADVVILEKAADLGGVWRDNTYPGVSCDIPAALYHLSRATRQGWARRFSTGADILAHLKQAAADAGIDRAIRFGTEVAHAAFDPHTGRWRITTADGEVLAADVLVPAVGQLSRPRLPAVRGRDGFVGAAFHTARWDHAVDLRGRRVAVIGTGASAVQIVPAIQPVAAAITLFQRSAPYVLPKPDRPYRTGRGPARAARRVAFPLARQLFYLMFELMTLVLTTGLGPLEAVLARLARWQRRRQIPDPDLRRRMTPDYRIGCKRVMLSNDFYPALSQPNVDVVTEEIDAITPGGVRTVDGLDHPADAIVYATGFTTTEFLAPMAITGSDLRSLNDAWKDGPTAYLGMAVPGFPNMFLMYGPRTNLGAGSIISMLEPQANYITQAVRLLAAAGGPGWLSVRPQVAAAYDAEMDRRLTTTTWSGCRSWYRDAATGRVLANWPGTVREYTRRTRRFTVDDYEQARC